MTSVLVEVAAGVATLTLNRHLVWHMAGQSDPEVAHQLESRAMVATLMRSDPAEGAAAFRDKRPPRFTAPSEGVCLLEG